MRFRSARVALLEKYHADREQDNGGLQPRVLAPSDVAGNAQLTGDLDTLLLVGQTSERLGDVLGISLPQVPEVDEPAGRGPLGSRALEAGNTTQRPQPTAAPSVTSDVIAMARCNPMALWSSPCLVMSSRAAAPVTAVSMEITLRRTRADLL
jgi:hypothetical protein